MDSTELMATLDIGLSTPSTRIRGSELFQVLCPRIRIRGSSSPGIPVLALVITPGTFPVKADPILDTPPVRSKTSPPTSTIEATTASFFCSPYPTITTSSKVCESISMIILISD